MDTEVERSTKSLEDLGTGKDQEPLKLMGGKDGQTRLEGALDLPPAPQSSGAHPSAAGRGRNLSLSLVTSKPGNLTEAT